MAALAPSTATRRKRPGPPPQPAAAETSPAETQPAAAWSPTRIEQPTTTRDGAVFAQPGGKIYVSPMAWISCILGVVALVVVPAYWKYGLNFFLPSGSKMLHHTEEDWQRRLLPQKTLLFIGGHHRGGTTLLWELMAEHPLIGDFGTPFDTGSDYSEGSFLQDGMPTFGVGSENLCDFM